MLSNFFFDQSFILLYIHGEWSVFAISFLLLTQNGQNLAPIINPPLKIMQTYVETKHDKCFSTQQNDQTLHVTSREVHDSIEKEQTKK